MNGIAIVRKVPFKLASNRLVWGLVLCERQGLSLVFVQKPDEHRSHALIIAQENPAERCFEDSKATRFPCEHQDLTDVGSKLNALGAGLSREEFDNFFHPNDDWLE